MINGKLIFHSLSSGCCFFIVWDKVWVTMLKQSRRLHGPQTKVSLQNPIVSGVILGGVFEPSLVPIYIAGGFPWFGFCGSVGCCWCRQKWVGCLDFVGLKVSCSNFKCYVFRFVEAVFVFSRNVFTKSEDPTPPAFMLHRYLHTYIYTYTGYITLRCIALQHVYITLQYSTSTC